jgi:hypothetical protein
MNIKIDSIDYEIPSYMNLENYSKIYKVKDLFTEEYFPAKIISIVTGAPVEELLKYDYQEIQYVASYIMSLLPLDKPKFVDRFEIDGVKYGFFPKWQGLTFAEFVDIDTISTKKTDELLDLVHILAAIMYRPITVERSDHDFDIEPYEIKSMEARSELFKKKLDVNILLGAQFFFIKFAKRYSSYIQASSIVKIGIVMKIKLMWRMRKIIWAILFKKSSVGTWSSTELLEMILPNLTTSTKKE